MAVDRLQDSIRRLETWVEARDYAGWDPYDALNSPLLRRLTFGSRRMGQAWVQLFKRSPVNLRPLLRVPTGHNPKGMGLFLAAALRKHWTEGDEGALREAERLASWLRENATTGCAGASWGYNFPWPSRAFFAPAGTPTVVNTAFVARALLEAGDLATARSACDFVLRDLNRLEPAPDELCFSYTPRDRVWVYNASLLGAELLAAVYAETGEPELATAAMAAARFAVRRQREDGAWEYGVDRKRFGWVDNFHTGFVLLSLDTIRRSVGSNELEPALAAGYAFWKDRMFREDGAPNYYDNRVWPIDVHAAAQAILTFLAFADRDPDALALARRTAEWTIAEMQDPAGSFHFQIHRFHRIRIPYMRWSQAWMLRALRELAWHEAGRPLPAGTRPEPDPSGEKQTSPGPGASS